MPDLYLNIAAQPEPVLDAIAASMDARANEPAMQEICAAYMTDLPGPSATMLEIGCGNGASTALLQRYAAPASLTGVDPSAGLLQRARERFRETPNMTFAPGDVLSTGQPDASFDVVVAHTVYSHIPDPAGALAEAWRVLKPGGCLAIFDGDYATNTVALFDGDPLQAAMAATLRNMVHDPYIMRRLPKLMTEAGFVPKTTKAHGYVQTTKPAYLRSLIARGTDAAARAGECGPDLAAGFNAETDRRVRDGTFYGAILFVSLLARKPA